MVSNITYYSDDSRVILSTRDVATDEAARKLKPLSSQPVGIQAPPRLLTLTSALLTAAAVALPAESNKNLQSVIEAAPIC